MNTKKKHMSELIFTVTLFSVFLISGVLLVLFGVNVYQKINSESVANETVRTSVAYIREKVRQCGETDSIQVENISGHDTLSLYTTYNNEDYVTYIYYNDGNLKELFTKKSLGFNPQSGDSITDINSFTVKKEGSLLHINLTDTENKTHELFIDV